MKATVLVVQNPGGGCSASVWCPRYPVRFDNAPAVGDSLFISEFDDSECGELIITKRQFVLDGKRARLELVARPKDELE